MTEVPLRHDNLIHKRFSEIAIPVTGAEKRKILPFAEKSRIFSGRLSFSPDQLSYIYNVENFGAAVDQAVIWGLNQPERHIPRNNYVRVAGYILDVLSLVKSPSPAMPVDLLYQLAEHKNGIKSGRIEPPTPETDNHYLLMNMLYGAQTIIWMQNNYGVLRPDPYVSADDLDFITGCYQEIAKWRSTAAVKAIRLSRKAVQFRLLRQAYMIPQRMTWAEYAGIETGDELKRTVDNYRLIVFQRQKFNDRGSLF